MLTINETSGGVVFTHFASDLSVFPQYDVSINLPIINGMSVADIGTVH